MPISRRDFLTMSAWATLAASSPAFATSKRRSSPGPVEPGDVGPTLVAPGAPLALPPWKYGAGSFAADTVLMFRGNPAHTFYGTGPLPEAPRVAWTHELGHFATTLRGAPITWSGTGWTGQPSKLGDWIFVGSVDRHLYALNANTGALGWKLRAGRMFKSSVCVFENRLYEGNVDDYLRCIDAATGAEVWKFNSGADLDSSPCIVDGRLYIAGENGHARCMDPRTGREIWKTFLGGIGPGTPPGSNGSETSPAIADGEYYAATYDGDLFCLNTRDGSLRWKTRTGDDTDASPVVSGDFVYAAAEDKASFLYAFDRSNGREVWRYGGNNKGYWSTPAVADGRVFVGGDDARLHCVDAKSGDPVWTTKVGLAIWSSPCVVDGKVVFGSYDNHLYVLDAKTGHVIFSYDLGGRCISTPCIVDGRIYVGTATGRFYCFGK